MSTLKMMHMRRPVIVGKPVIKSTMTSADQKHPFPQTEYWKKLQQLSMLQRNM